MPLVEVRAAAAALLMLLPIDVFIDAMRTDMLVVFFGASPSPDEASEARAAAGGGAGLLGSDGFFFENMDMAFRQTFCVLSAFR